MKKRRNKVIGLIFALIIGNLLLFMVAKSTYGLADGLEVGSPDYEAARDLMYFWFDESNHLRYVFSNIIIVALLFLIKTPTYLRAFMIIYLGVSIKAAIMYPINGNTGTFFWDAVILILGLLWLLKKALTDWQPKTCVIAENDLSGIYRITTPSNTLHGTLLSVFGKDIESVSYYAYDTLYKFTKRTSRYIAIECEPEAVLGNAERITCDSKVFAACLDEKVGSRYKILCNNCENVTNQAKARVGLKKRIFPQIN